MFTLTGKLPEKKKDIKEFFSKFYEYIYPDFKHFAILVVIAIVKLLFVFAYIHLYSQQMNTKERIDMIVIIFVYINTAFNLNRTLGNNDLKRKSKQMNQFRDLIDF